MRKFSTSYVKQFASLLDSRSVRNGPGHPEEGPAKTVKIQITATGGVQMLHDDEIDLSEFGHQEVTRASNVEPYTCDHGGVEWGVWSAKTGYLLEAGFHTRAEAIEWEKNHYSPGGPGWAELTDNDSDPLEPWEKEMEDERA